MKTARTYLQCLLLCFLFTHTAAADVQSPTEVIRTITEAVVQYIEANRAALDADPEKIYAVVDEFILPHLDFNSMSKWILGKNWQTATAEQKSAFIEQFKTLMIRTYSRALLEYSGQDIKYFPAEQKANAKLAVVKTEITKKDSKPLTVIYRMYQKQDAWKVVDVAIDNISLVVTYRGSFAAQIQKSGLNVLIEDLANKNKQL